MKESARVGYWCGVAFTGFGTAVILWSTPMANPPLVCAIVGALGLVTVAAHIAIAYRGRR